MLSNLFGNDTDQVEMQEAAMQPQEAHMEAPQEEQKSGGIMGWVRSRIDRAMHTAGAMKDGLIKHFTSISTYVSSAMFLAAGPLLGQMDNAVGRYFAGMDKTMYGGEHSVASVAGAAGKMFLIGGAVTAASAAVFKGGKPDVHNMQSASHADYGYLSPNAPAMRGAVKRHV